MIKSHRNIPSISKTLIASSFITLVLVAFVVCFFQGIQHDNNETAMELSPRHRIAHDMQIVREHPSEAAAHQQLANSYSYGHREKEAVEEYKEAVRLSHGKISPGLYHSLAISLLATGQRSQARKALASEIELDAPLCQTLPKTERYTSEITCQSWTEAQSLLKKYP